MPAGDVPTGIDHHHEHGADTDRRGRRAGLRRNDPQHREHKYEHADELSQVLAR
jgi:hypothetical protein